MDHEDYALQLLHLSARIVGAVHDEGPDAISKAIDQALIVEAPAGVDPVQALVAVLAAQVDDRLRHSQSLGWLKDRMCVSTMTALARQHEARERAALSVTTTRRTAA